MCVFTCIHIDTCIIICIFTYIGINGGVFFARGRTKKTNGEFLQLRDLAPGNVINILGRDIHLYDADKFTRDYFRRELKLVLPPVMEGPQAMR
jgi:hypothetical protein